ncbi:hypothetical protein [Kitasatospora sp. NPDC050463]
MRIDVRIVVPIDGWIHVRTDVPIDGWIHVRIDVRTLYGRVPVSGG